MTAPTGGLSTTIKAYKPAVDVSGCENITCSNAEPKSDTYSVTLT